MPAIRERFNFQAGSFAIQMPADGAFTVMSSPELSNFPQIDGVTNYANVVAGTEIMWITLHNPGASTATVSRAQEGTSVGLHLVGERWEHGPTAFDYDFTGNAQGFNFRGPWAPSTAYAFYDVYAYGGSSWLVTTAYTSVLVYGAVDVNNTFGFARGSIPNVRLVTSSTLAQPNDLLLCDCTGGNIVITAPASPANGSIFWTKKYDTGPFSVTVTGSMETQANGCLLNRRGHMVGLAWDQNDSTWQLFQSRLSRGYDPDRNNYLGATVDPQLATSTNNSYTMGSLYLHKTKLPLGGLVGHIRYNLAIAGGTLSSGQCFLALYDLVGNRIGLTPDQASSWTSASFKNTALTAPTTAQQLNGEIWVGLLINKTSGATPSFSALPASLIGNDNQAANSLSYCITADTNLTSMPNTININTLSGQNSQLAFFALTP